MKWPCKDQQRSLLFHRILPVFQKDRPPESPAGLRARSQLTPRQPRRKHLAETGAQRLSKRKYLVLVLCATMILSANDRRPSWILLISFDCFHGGFYAASPVLPLLLELFLFLIFLSEKGSTAHFGCGDGLSAVERRWVRNTVLGCGLRWLCE